FYNKRGTCEQWIKEGKGAIKWTWLSLFRRQRGSPSASCAYNLGNFLRTLATPETIEDWSMTTLKEKLIKIGAKVVSRGRYVAFQMAEVAIRRQPYRREALDCFASDQKPKVRLWMTTKSTFSALGANVTGLGAREPRVEGLALPKSVECGNLSFSRTGIRWMSDKARFAFAEGLVPKQDAS
ncbi:MAG: transposase, partial [Methylocella sp.]